MGKARKFYTIEEDVCLAEALIDTGWDFKPYGLKTAVFPDVYNGFVTKVSKFGIDGSVRTTKSLQTHVYALKEAVKNGRLLEHADSDNPLLQERHDILLRAFGVGKPPRAQPSSEIRAPQTLQLAPRTRTTPQTLQLASTARQAGRASVGGNSVTPRQPRYERIQKQQHMTSKRLLHALNLKHKRRIEVELEREETVRRQQEADQMQRKRNMYRFKKVLQSASSEDDVIAYLRLLEDLNAEDTQRCMLREEDVRDRIESDLERSNWERSVLEELIDNDR